MNPSLLNVDAEQAKHPFSGRPPPRSLEEFFSDVLDRDLLEDFSTPRGDLVTQSNIAASTVESLHNKANNRMRKEGILLDQDDYTGRDSSSKTVCRPPFDSLHIMSAPWLSRYNRGKVPHVGVFSTKHMLLFHANGWQQSSCVYFSEDSTIPSSILNGSAWSSTQETEGRSIIERLQMRSFNESTTTEDDSLEITFEKTEPKDDNWWLRWNNGSKLIGDIVTLFETEDEAFDWSPAREWNKTGDRNYQYLCKYYIVILLNKIDQKDKFVALHLRKVDVFQDERVPHKETTTIVNLARDSSFIEIIKN